MKRSKYSIFTDVLIKIFTDTKREISNTFDSKSEWDIDWGIYRL